MGGPNIPPVQSNLQTPPGPPNAYNEEPVAALHRRAGPPGADTAATARTRGDPGAGRADTCAGARACRTAATRRGGRVDGRRPVRRTTSAMRARSKPNQRPLKGMMRMVRHRARQGLALLAAAITLTSCASWHGIANVPMPGGPGTGAGSYTVYVQMPDTLALNDNSRVRVADVFVGTVRAVKLSELGPHADVESGQERQVTQERHRQDRADKPAGFAACRAGHATRPVAGAAEKWRHYPTEEFVWLPHDRADAGQPRPDLARRRHPESRTMQNEVYNIVNGRADQIRAFLGKLDTFTARLDEQSDDITRAIDSTNGLLAYVRFPRGCSGSGVHRIHATDQTLRRETKPVHQRCRRDGTAQPGCQPIPIPLAEQPPSGPAVAAVPIAGTRPCLTVSDQRTQADPLRAVPCRLRAKVVPGDYFNLSLTVDLTLSAVDNAVLTGTGFSGALRALEQSYGRDPETMIPDVRYTPNPNDAPGGPLVERADRQC